MKPETFEAKQQYGFSIEKTNEGANGTYLHGYINASYSDIKKLLGKPDPDNTDGYKVDAEWDFKINGKIMTLYNYKTGRNYLKSKGLSLSKITTWHVGAGSCDITNEANYLASKLNGIYTTDYSEHKATKATNK